jgi:hypothetical protein
MCEVMRAVARRRSERVGWGMCESREMSVCVDELKRRMEYFLIIEATF